ncbi:MAG: hypothetical protein ACJ8AD_17025 [Gemmatimonadaceae bacterium]
MRCIPASSFVLLVLLPANVVAQVRVPTTSGAEPNACVAATGPDVGASGADSTARARSARAAIGRPDSAQRTAVYLFAAVEAQEVRFVGQPKICVRLNGDVQLDSVRVVARRNITSPVVSGTTYRDVYVAVEILGRLNADCISARITGVAAGTSAGGSCASVGLRDSASVRPTPRGSPP